MRSTSPSSRYLPAPGCSTTRRRRHRRRQPTRSAPTTRSHPSRRTRCSRCIAATSTRTAADRAAAYSVVPPQRFVARIETVPTAHNARPSNSNVAVDDPVRGNALASAAAGATVTGGGGGGGGGGATTGTVVVVAVPLPT